MKTRFILPSFFSLALLALLGSLAQPLDAPRILPAADTVWLEEMTWIEVRDALRAGKTTVLIGTGGIEQNGPYVALGKHNYVLKATTEAIARRLGNALVAPIVPFVPEGSIDPPSGHMRYPGTISVRQETYEALLTDICASLKQHGFLNLILIGDSGDNQTGMERVAGQLNAQWKGERARVHFIREYYSTDNRSVQFLRARGLQPSAESPRDRQNEVHSAYHYEAIMATLDPNLIRARERLAAGLFEVNGVNLESIDKVVENGRQLIDYRARITIEAIEKALRKSAE